MNKISRVLLLKYFENDVKKLADNKEEYDDIMFAIYSLSFEELLQLYDFMRGLDK